MLLVDIERVSQDMILARPVFHSQRSAQPILQTGSELPPAMINRLKEMGLRAVWIKKPSDVPETDPPAVTRGQQADESIEGTSRLVDTTRDFIHKADVISLIGTDTVVKHATAVVHLVLAWKTAEDAKRDGDELIRLRRELKKAIRDELGVT